jgi:hypothetical protein
MDRTQDVPERLPAKLYLLTRLPPKFVPEHWEDYFRDAFLSDAVTTERFFATLAAVRVVVPSMQLTVDDVALRQCVEAFLGEPDEQAAFNRLDFKGKRENLSRSPTISSARRGVLAATVSVDQHFEGLGLPHPESLNELMATVEGWLATTPRGPRQNMLKLFYEIIGFPVPTAEQEGGLGTDRRIGLTAIEGATQED